MLTVALHQRQHAFVPGGFMVLRKHFEHDHARPPIVVARGTDHAIRLLMRERPLNPLLRLLLQRAVVQLIGQRHQSVEIVGTALPTLAFAAEPSAGGTDIGPDLFEVSGEPIGLDPELIA